MAMRSTTAITGKHQDKSLSRVDFLRYEDGLYWKLACFNPHAYQNRLRHSDYIGHFRKHGCSAILPMAFLMNGAGRTSNTAAGGPLPAPRSPGPCDTQFHFRAPAVGGAGAW